MLINHSFDLGKTALQFAAGIGDSELVKILLDAGANIETQDTNG